MLKTLLSEKAFDNLKIIERKVKNLKKIFSVFSKI